VLLAPLRLPLRHSVRGRLTQQGPSRSLEDKSPAAPRWSRGRAPTAITKGVRGSATPSEQLRAGCGGGFKHFACQTERPRRVETTEPLTAGRSLRGPSGPSAKALPCSHAAFCVPIHRCRTKTKTAGRSPYLCSEWMMNLRTVCADLSSIEGISGASGPNQRRQANIFRLCGAVHCRHRRKSRTHQKDAWDRIHPVPARRILSSAGDHDQAFAHPSRRADPTGSQF
jgi:hypothetical protein